MSLLLGIDIGTSQTKVGCFDAHGHPVGLAVVSHSAVLTPRHGWAEQDPEGWWRALLAGISQALAAVEDAASVAAVGIGAQAPCLVAVDAGFRPIRPALIWSDERAVEEAQELSQISGQLVKVNSLAAKALWLQRNEPEIYARSRWLLGCGEFIIAKLCGEAVSMHPVPPEVIAATEIPTKLLPTYFPPGSVVGWVSEAAAQQIGLPPRIPVVSGWVDSFIAILGTGVVSDGQACLNGGSAGTVTVLCAEPPSALPPGPFRVGRRGSVSQVLRSTGQALQWFRDRLGRAEESYDSLLAEAEQVPAGAGGLLFLSYLSGAGAPLFDPQAKGAWFGLTLGHTRAHLVRALLEGSAFAFRQALEYLEAGGAMIRELRINGGQAKSPLWNQIKADVFHRPLTVPVVLEAGTLGAAILASVALGWHHDVEAAAQAMVHIQRVYQPDSHAARIYDEAFARYTALYPRIRDLFAG